MSTEKKRVKADDYDGAVYWADRDGDLGDGYFGDVSGVRLYCERHELPLPSEGDPAYGCTVSHLQLDAEDILYRAFEDGEHHEGASDSLSHEAEEALKKFVAEWNAKYGVEVTSYMADETTVIVFDEPAADCSPDAGPVNSNELVELYPGGPMVRPLYAPAG